MTGSTVEWQAPGGDRMLGTLREGLSAAGWFIVDRVGFYNGTGWTASFAARVLVNPSWVIQIIKAATPQQEATK